MKPIIILLLCFLCWTQAKAQLSFQVNNSVCMLEVWEDSTEVRYMFDLSEARYVDRSNQVAVFDNRMSVGVRLNQLDNFPSLAALKTQLDTWFLNCEN